MREKRAESFNRLGCDLPLLIEGQLLSQEQNLRAQGCDQFLDVGQVQRIASGMLPDKEPCWRLDDGIATYDNLVTILTGNHRTGKSKAAHLKKTNRIVRLA